MVTNLNRKPPSSKCKKLRQEVQFGCPVEGCGSPYLSWHHFDPPWAEKKIHNVNGMIALCLQHHNQADGGAFTRDQLSQLKKYPYLKGIGEFPKGRFNWRREQLFVIAGGNYYLGAENILEVDGHRIVWLSKDVQGCEEINLDIRTANCTKLLSMHNNDWEVHIPLSDLVCPPSGNSLKLLVKGEGISLNLEFMPLVKAQFNSKIDIISEKQRAFFLRAHPKNISQETGNYKQWMETKDSLTSARPPLVSDLVNRVVADWTEENITLCMVRARLKWPEELHITKHYLKTYKDNHFGGNLFFGCGLKIKDGSPCF